MTASLYANYKTCWDSNDVDGTVINNTNTWGWSAQGKLRDADGKAVRFNGFIRQQFGNESGPKVVSQINVH